QLDQGCLVLWEWLLSQQLGAQQLGARQLGAQQPELRLLVEAFAVTLLLFELSVASLQPLQTPQAHPHQRCFRQLCAPQSLAPNQGSPWQQSQSDQTAHSAEPDHSPAQLQASVAAACWEAVALRTRPLTLPEVKERQQELHYPCQPALLAELVCLE